MTDTSVKSRGWCLTLNNPTTIEYDELRSTMCAYHIIGRETGESGTPHLQGYFFFKEPVRLSKMKKLSPRAHWEAAKGSPEQNITYCSKQDPLPAIHGDPPKSSKAKGEGEKARWASAVAHAKTGTFDDIPEDIYMRFYRTIKEISKDHMVKPDDALGTTGVWYVGPPGCGKSRRAREEHPGSYLKMCNKWWDGYQQEQTVIIDDLDKVHIVLGHHLKIWSDRYSFLAENKGGAIHIRPKTIIVTSNYSIDDIWEDADMREAIKRRFRVEKMGGYQMIAKPLYYNPSC